MLNTILSKTINNKNFLSFAGNGISAIFGVIVFALLARTFSADVFGEWVIYLSTATFIEMFRFGLTRTGLVRFLSGAEGEERVKLMGTNYIIGIVITGFIFILLYLTLILFQKPIMASPYKLFFIWYPLLAIFNLPFNNALTILQAEERFLEIMLIKVVNLVSFTLLLSLNYFLDWGLSLQHLILWHLAINLATSVFVIILGWDGIFYVKFYDKKTLQTLLNFGKYTTVTLIGSNLLRSADTFILSISPLGSAAVATYSIPLKLMEMLQIPLRSFASTAFPKLSRASINNEIGKFKFYFYHYTGIVTIMFLPIIVICFFFAKYFVLILAGPEYIKPFPLTGESTIFLFQIFVLYGFLLPLDRMTGVGLDAINKPEKNFYKIIAMVSANIIGDLIAVFVFRKLLFVAYATWIFTLIGVVLGYIYLNNEIPLKFSKIFTIGWKSIIQYFFRKQTEYELK
jgi:O-antigen/teichoic acid export membrane protein